MAVNHHITASANHGGNFTAGKVPTINLQKYFPLLDARAESEPDFFFAPLVPVSNVLGISWFSKHPSLWNGFGI